MKQILILNGSNTGTSIYFAKKIAYEQLENHEGKQQVVKIIDLSKELRGQLMTSETILSGSFYADSETYINMLLEADKIIAVTSMTNFAISDTMKAFINKVVVNGKTFTYGANGPIALLEEKFKNKEIFILFTSGSPKEFLPAAVQHIPKTLADTFKFIGFRNISIHWGDGTNTPDMLNKSLDEIYEAMLEKINFNFF